MRPRPPFLLAAALLALVRPASAGVWTNIGPSGGYVQTVTIDPSTPTTLYAGTGLRVFKSTDAGLHWVALVHPVGEVFSGEVVVDPFDSSTIYIPGGGNDVVKSTDGGATFVRHSTGMFGAGSLAIDPINPQNLWAGGMGSIARSTDAGVTWTIVPLPGGATDYLFDLAVDPVTPSTLYAGASFGTAPGVYKSVDGGASYTRVLAGPGVQSVAVDPSSPSTVFANDVTIPLLYRSINAGASWGLSDAGLINGALRRCLVVDPTNSLIVYAGVPEGVVKSVTGGTSWVSASAGLPFFPTAQCLVIHPSAPSTVYAALKLGVGKTTDGGASWTVLQDGLFADYPLSLAVDPSAPNVIYAGSQNLGISKSTDGGATWTSASTGLTGYPVSQVIVHPTNSSILYAVDGGISESLDAGVTWDAGDAGMADQASRIALAPSNPSTLYAASNGGVYKSIDGGALWNLTAGTPSLAFTQIAVDPTNDAVAWAAGVGLDVYRTTDGGDTWTPSSALPSFYGGKVVGLAVDPAAPATLYAGVQPGTVSAIVRSVDGGVTWEIVKSGAAASEFAFIPGSPSTVFAASIGGVLGSRDGTTWSALTTLDMPYVYVASLALAPPQLYAGIFAHSVWRRSIATCTTVAECDDGSVCTTDTCDPGNPLADVVGCVHATVTCPAPGDCQTATCDPYAGCVSHARPDGSVCTDDGTICTNDVCRSGTCAHTPAVASGCKLPTLPKASTLAFKGTDPAHAKLVWNWKKGQATSLGQVGDPFTAGASDYTLCGFDRSGSGGTYALRFSVTAPAGGNCPTKPCWTNKGTNVGYKDKERTPDGADTLVLRPGPDGAAKITMTAKSTHLALPATALAPDVRVQLRRDDAAGICWEAGFATTIQTNTSGVFKAKSD